MTTTETVLSQNMDIDKTGLFFVPKTKDVLPIIADGMQKGDDKLRWFGTHEGDIFDAMDYIVMCFHDRINGRINLGYLFNTLKDIAKIFEMATFFKNLAPKNFGDGAVDARAESEEHLIGVGVLNADYADGDADPYETAGGYRSWIAPKGTVVKYYLNANLSIRAEFDSNCVTDHYNNNFFGVSTGGGTTEYKLGERVEKRSVTLGREAFDKGWKAAKIDAKAVKIDYAKAKALCAEFVPEFAFIFE